MTGPVDAPGEADAGAEDPWQGWARADAEVRAAYAELGGLYRDVPDNPAGFRDVDEHRFEVVLPALETAHAAAQVVIAALIAESHHRTRPRLPGRVGRWWRRITGTGHLDGPVGQVLAEVAVCFGDSWTAREAGGSMACGEVDSLARLLDLGGHRDAGAQLLCGHAETDDHGDPHAALVPLPGRTAPGPAPAQLHAARHHLAGLHRAAR